MYFSSKLQQGFTAPPPPSAQQPITSPSVPPPPDADGPFDVPRLLVKHLPLFLSKEAFQEFFTHFGTVLVVAESLF